jgi:hypothetical protein
MTRILRIATAIFVLAHGAAAFAAPPTITNITPPGAQRGRPAEILVTGSNLTPKTQLVLPFPATQKLLTDAKPNPAQAKFQVTVDEQVPLGIYPVRVLTEDGISALALFVVEAFPSVAETEDNGAFEKAQKISLPVVIDGQCSGGDEDYYRFTAKKGQRIVVETVAARLGSGVMPQTRVADGKRRFVAADASGKLRGDCRLSFVAPDDGEYVVEFSDSRYRGGAPPFYRLKIGEYDFADEVFPLGGRRGEQTTFTFRGGSLPGDIQIQRLLTTLPPSSWFSPSCRLLDLQGTPFRPGMFCPEIALGDYPERLYTKADAKGMTLTVPVTVNGRLEQKEDVHRFQLAVQAGQRYRFQVEAESLGSFLDGVLRLTDPAGKELAKSDDVDVPPAVPGQQTMRSLDPSVEFTVPTGTSQLGIELRDALHRGGLNFSYRLTVEPVVDDFGLVQTAAEVNVPVGGSAAVPIRVVRAGYNGPIQLAPSDLPAGLSVQGGYVPEGGTSGVLTVTASNGLTGPVYLAIEGRAIGKDLVRRAVQRFVVNKDGNVPPSSYDVAHLALATSSAIPITLQTPDKIEVVNGYPATVDVKVKRQTKPPLPPVEVTGLVPAPVGNSLRIVLSRSQPTNVLTVKPGTAAADKDQAAVTVSVPINAPAGRFIDLVLQGKAKVDNKDVLATAQAVPLTVLPPFAIDVATAKLDVMPGQMVTLKGKITRHPMFKEPVQLKLDGLPAGVALTAPPKAVAADQSEFQLELKVDAKAAAATAKLTLNASAIIGGQNYAHPPVTVPIEVSAVKKKP